MAGFTAGRLQLRLAIATAVALATLRISVASGDSSTDSVASHGAGEDTRVIIASSPEEPSPPGLREAVAIQLAGVARVEEGPELSGRDRAERIEEAKAWSSGGSRRVVIWLDVEPSKGGDAASNARPAPGRALYAVGGPAGDENDAPRLHVASSAPQGEGPEAERAIALKAREVIAAIEARWDRPEPRAPEEPGARDRARAGPVPRPVLELAGGAAVAGGNAGVRPQLAVAAGVTSPWRGGDLELVGAIRVPRAAEVESPSGAVSTREVAIGLSGRYALGAGATETGEVAAGAHVSTWLRRVSAEGRAASGESGSARRYVPALRTGPEVRWEATSRLWLRAAGAVEIATRRQQFSIEGDPVADLGRIRLGLTLAIGASWP